MISDIVMLICIPVFLFMIVLFHEFGHFVLARIFGVKIDALSLGYGKVVWERYSPNKYTRWRIRQYPIAGRVTLNHQDFEALSFFKQVLVIMAGPVFNVILPFLLMFFAFLLIGQPSKPPVLTGIKIGEVGEQAGLKVGDVILEINGIPVIDYEQIMDIKGKLPPVELSLKIGRGENIVDIALTPTHDEYVDIKGIKRSHGVMGAFAHHTPLWLKHIVKINEIEVKDKDHARALVIAAFDQDIILTLETADNRDNAYTTRIHSKLNQHLFDEDHKHYKKFYLGEIGDNFYHRLSLFESASLAGKTATRMFMNIVKLPAQVFPIDGSKLKTKNPVKDEDTAVQNFVFRSAFFMSIMSIVIGFINLIPLPHFDGGQLLLLSAQKCTRRPLTPKNNAMIIMVALFTLYGAMMAVNFTKLPLYFEAKIEAVTEWWAKR